jgi:hypothetical protein
MLNGQSLISSLGLADILRQREQEAEQLGALERMKGQVDIEKFRARSRKRRGAFETLGTIAGAVGGAMVGGPAGASVGAKIGGGLAGEASGGERPMDGSTADILQRGVQGVAQISEMQQQRQAKQQQQRQLLQKQEQQQAFENVLDLRRLELEEQKLGTQQLNAQLDKVDKAVKQEDVLRKEYNPIKVKFDDISAANQKIQSSILRETAAGDVAAIFSFMKVLDPGSVVREGEQALARNAAGVPQRIRNLYNRALEGQSLNPAQRQDFLSTTKELFRAEQNNYAANVRRLREVADNRGLNDTNIFGNIFFDSAEDAEAANLPVGTYVFIDGRSAVIK